MELSVDYRNDGNGKECGDEKTKGIPAQATSSVSSQRATLASDSLTTYLNDIRKPELLTAEEECHCARQALLGDETGRRKLIESNLRLVVNIAKRYMHRGMALADLVEEGNLGLIHSVGKFDPELGYRFSTYSTWWIRQTIERGLMNQARTVRLPVHVVKEMRAMMRIDR